MKLSTFVLAGAILLGATVGVRADTLALWTFESVTTAGPGPFQAEGGINSGSSSEASGYHISSSAAYATAVGNGSNLSYNSDHWSEGDYYQFTTSAAGYQNLQLSFEQGRSSNGPPQFQAQYSTDGTTFSTFGSAYTVAEISSWSRVTYHTGYSHSFDLSTLAVLNDANTIWFRLVETAHGNSSLGTSRVDNVTISGEPIPAVPLPSSAFAGGALLCMLGVNRSRKLNEKTPLPS